MRILFWGPTIGHCNVTSSMLAVGATLAQKHMQSTAMLQVQLKDKDLQEVMLGRNAGNVDDAVNEAAGIDVLIRRCSSGNVGIDSVLSCALPFFRKKLNIIPSTKKTDKNVYEQELIDALNPTLIAMDNAFSYTLVDVGSGHNKITSELLKEADLIVVCIDQNTKTLNHLFTKYKLNPDQVFFLMTKYDKDLQLSVRNVMAMYKQVVQKGKIGTIPYSVGYANALNSKDVAKFFMANINTDKTSSCKDFITAVDKTTTSIMQCSEDVKNKFHLHETQYADDVEQLTSV